MYETFEHTADLGIRASADTRQGLFAEMGLALFSVIVANLDEVRPVVRRTLRVEGQDPEYLLVDWLSELLYLYEHASYAASRIDVAFDADGMAAELAGEKLDAARHRREHEVKAVTYHELRVEQTSDGWMAEVILDI